jgi:hypothetical protein
MSVEETVRRAETAEAGTNDVAERWSPSLRSLSAVVIGDGASRLTKVTLAVLSLAAAAAVAVGVAPFVSVPLAALLFAAMGAGSVMLLRSRRLR